VCNDQKRQGRHIRSGVRQRSRLQYVRPGPPIEPNLGRSLTGAPGLLDDFRANNDPVARCQRFGVTSQFGLRQS
jgi:hypothetical protein